jgi:DNA polymerase-3 subunit epsilon
MADQLDLLGGLQPTVRASAPESNPRASAPTPQLEDSQPEESDSRAASPPSVVPRTLLILDTETTGLDPETHHCVEVGAILFDVQSRAVLAQQSFLLPAETNAAEPINRIPAAVTRLPQPWKEGLRWFQNLLDAADVLVAHNAAFDRQWFGRGELPAVTQPWLCSMDDMRWPADRQLRSRPSVRDLALAYGVPVWAAHRALTDCIYLAEVFARCEDLEQQLLQGLEPRQLVRAKVSYDDRQLARDAGFRWNDPIKGAWARRMSEREIQELSFPVAPVDLEAGDSKT